MPVGRSVQNRGQYAAGRRDLCVPAAGVHRLWQGVPLGRVTEAAAMARDSSGTWLSQPGVRQARRPSDPLYPGQCTGHHQALTQVSFFEYLLEWVMLDAGL